MDGNEDPSCSHVQLYTDHLGVRVAPLPGIPNSFCFYITGYIDRDNATWFADQIRQLLAEKPPAVLFELSAMTYTGDVGISSFLQFLKMVRLYGGAFALCCVQPRVREVFALLGFSSFFDVDSSYQDAVDSLARRYVSEES